MLEMLKQAWTMLSSNGFLSSNRFRTLFLYTRELLEELMYGSMMKHSWFVALGASPIYLVMMPMFSILLTGMALVDVYELIMAEDKTIDKWLNAIVGSICACTAMTSITLLEITLITGVPFAIGPWFFLAGVVIFSGNALFQTGLNLWRAYKSDKGSQERLDHIQTSINWAFILGTVAAVIGCVLFVILFPTACTQLGVAFAATTVACTTASILWRMTPSSLKSLLKQTLGLEKLPLDENDEHKEPMIEEVVGNQVTPILKPFPKPVKLNITPVPVPKPTTIQQDGKNGLGWGFGAKKPTNVGVDNNTHALSGAAKTN